MPENLINETNIITRIEEELPKSTLYWFFISLLAAVFWTIYITYYNSRVIGLIATLIINKFVKYGRVNVGEYIFYLFNLTLVLLNLDLSIFENTVVPDQLAFEKPADQDQHFLPLCL